MVALYIIVTLFVTIPTYCRGFVVEREKVTPAVGIKFIIEEKIFNLSGPYYKYKNKNNKDIVLVDQHAYRKE